MSRPTARCPRRRPAAPGGLRLLAACGVLAAVVSVASGWSGVALTVVALLAAVVATAELVVLPARSGPSRWAAPPAAGTVGAADLDRRHADVLVARADAWLVASPDGVGAREPAVVRVRASVDRLDALAARGAAAAQVAAELHELEHAVASLLGTAGLPVVAVPHQRARPAMEWTTTGAVR